MLRAFAAAVAERCALIANSCEPEGELTAIDLDIVEVVEVQIGAVKLARFPSPRHRGLWTPIAVDGSGRRARKSPAEAGLVDAMLRGQALRGRATSPSRPRPASTSAYVLGPGTEGTSPSRTAMA